MLPGNRRLCQRRNTLGAEHDDVLCVILLFLRRVDDAHVEVLLYLVLVL